MVLVMTLRPLLTIAGFDPSSGAGITADLFVFAAHGFFGTSATTALTVQSTLGVLASHPVAAHVLSASLDCLEEDLPAGGIKIGMLATADNVRSVASFLERKRLRDRVPVVLDPVLLASSGRALLSLDGLEVLREELLPLVDWATPNRQELGWMLGRKLDTSQDVEDGARELASHFPDLSLVATGGDTDSADDLVYTSAGGAEWMRGRRIASDATHGTGCAFSSALLCGLCGKRDGLEAARMAKEYVALAIQTAVRRGGGKGPMNLLWPLGEPV